jgi:deoxyribonuclease-4
MQWSGPPLKPDEIVRFRQRTGLVFAHSGYLLNLASPDATNRQRSIVALVDEIERATALGVPFIVMHPGAHLGAGEETGLRTLVASLDEVSAATGKSNVRVALETTAGQGTCLGHRFEHLAFALAKCRRPSRLAVCVDTCHIFAAGYDIRTPRSYEATMREFDRVVGHRHVVAFHLNDSKKPLGSRVDRHEHIGQGHIGLPAFRCVLRDARWAGLPMALETPKSADLHEDVENLRVLRSLLPPRVPPV